MNLLRRIWRRCSLEKFDWSYVSTCNVGAEAYIRTHLVSDLDSQVQLLEIPNTDQLNIHIVLEVTLVFRCLNKLLQLSTQSQDIRIARSRGNAEVVLLLHRLAARDVLDPQSVGDIMRNLHCLVGIDTAEDRIHKRDAFDNERNIANIDAITDIVRVLDEKEDDTGEEFGDGTANSECETSKRRPELRCAGGECCAEEGGVDQSNSNENDEAKDVVEYVNRVADVLHAGGAVLAIFSQPNYQHCHLFHADISVSIAIKRSKDDISLGFARSSEHFEKISFQENISAVANE